MAPVGFSLQALEHRRRQADLGDAPSFASHSCDPIRDAGHLCQFGPRIGSRGGFLRTSSCIDNRDASICAAHQFWRLGCARAWGGVRTWGRGGAGGRSLSLGPHGRSRFAVRYSCLGLRLPCSAITHTGSGSTRARAGRFFRSSRVGIAVASVLSRKFADKVGRVSGGWSWRWRSTQRGVHWRCECG